MQNKYSGSKSTAEKPTYEELERRIEDLEAELERREGVAGDGAATSPLTEMMNQLRFQKTLFDTIPSPIFYKDKGGVYLGCNKAFSALILGLPQEKIIGCTLYDLPELIPKDLADIYCEQDQALFENPGLQVYEAKVKCSDGQTREYVFYKSTYSDHGGNVAGILGLMLDVTEKNEIQLKLQESQEKYRSMMESMSDAVYICSPDLTISYMNPVMRARVGYDAVGEKCYKALHNLDEPCPWCTFAQVQQGFVTETEVDSPLDGRSYIVSNSPIQHHDGRVSKMTIYHDITGRIKLERELLMAKKLEAAGVFAGGIAHDYNNLLFVILGNLLLLKNDLESSVSQALAQNIEDAAQKAASLTKKLLAFTYDESLTLERTVVDRVIENVVEDAIKHEENFSVSMQLPETRLMAYADGSLLAKVLGNLLENSKDALGEDGGTIFIEAEKVVLDESSDLIQNRLLKKTGEYVRIAVADKGFGIADEIKPYIFDPYFSTKQKGEQKGLGLGLSTSYSIIKKHGGNLRLESDTTMVTTLALYLPVVNPASNKTVRPE